MPSIAILIPARRASTRLPEKLLLAEHGEPLIATAARQAARAFGAGSVVVCCDDPALADAARTAGVAARLTRLDHASGTDRIAEVAAGIDADILVNVQGDEPEMDPEHIRLVAGLLDRHPWAGMATLAVSAGSDAQSNPNQVKVVLALTPPPVGRPVPLAPGPWPLAPGPWPLAPGPWPLAPGPAEGRALWFTRAPAVFDRDAGSASATCFRHLGIYAYRRSVLLSYARLPASDLERIEKLEQLRALSAGIGIACAVVGQAAPGIDIRADYDAFLARWRSRRDSQHAPIHP